MRTKKQTIDSIVRKCEKMPGTEIVRNPEYKLPAEIGVSPVVLDLEISGPDYRALYAIFDIKKSADPRVETWETAYALSLVKEDLENKGETRPIFIWLWCINACPKDLHPRLLRAYEKYENERAISTAEAPMPAK